MVKKEKKDLNESNLLVLVQMLLVGMEEIGGETNLELWAPWGSVMCLLEYMEEERDLRFWGFDF